MARPRVSIVIVSWNGRALLERCLPSVLATDYPDLEVILADNASTDGSAAWVARHHPEVTVVRHPENWLFARGNNAALPHASGRHVLLLNNDVEVPPGWLHPLVDVLEREPDVAAVQPKLLQHNDRSTFEYAGAAGGHLDRLGYPFTRGRMFTDVEPDRGQYDAPADVFWATGAALLVRREAFEAVGGLDERFEMHMEEIDLCWRLQRAGWRVRAEPASTAYHIGGASLAQGDPRKAYYNYRNSLLMLYKNLPPAAWRRTWPARLALDAAAAARALLQGNGAEARAIAQAYRDAFRMRPHYQGARPAAGDRAVYPSYRGVAPVDYFLRGRTRFSELPAHRFREPYRA
jgi:hypothetical protein